jgi:hypothetical protein
VDLEIVTLFVQNRRVEQPDGGSLRYLYTVCEASSLRNEDSNTLPSTIDVDVKMMFSVYECGTALQQSPV